MFFSLYRQTTIISWYNKLASQQRYQTNLKKVARKHFPQLRALAAEESQGSVKKPRFKAGYEVLIAKEDSPLFKKRYKQKFTWII